MSETASASGSTRCDEPTKRPRDPAADTLSLVGERPTVQLCREARGGDVDMPTSSPPDVDIAGQLAAISITACEAVKADEYVDDNGDDEEDGEDDDSRELLLRVAELRSSLVQNVAQHNFAVRVAQRETRTLQHYTQQQDEWLKTYKADRIKVHEEMTRLAASLAAWHDLARLAALWRAESAEQTAARAAWEHRRLQLLCEAQTRSRAASARREMYAVGAGTQPPWGVSTATRPGALPVAEKRNDTMQTTQHTDYWRDALKTVEAEVNIGRLAESVAPLMPQPARQAAMRGVAMQLQQLAAHSKMLIARCQALPAPTQDAEQPRRQAVLDGALQALQQRLHCLVRCLDPREHDVLERHVKLDRDVTRLRLAVRLLAQENPDPPADSLARAAEAYAKVQEEEQALEAQYKALVAEVIFLRKWGTVSARDDCLTALDLTLPAQVHVPQPVSRDAPRRLSEALLRCCNEMLVGIIRTALYDDASTTPPTEAAQSADAEQSMSNVTGATENVQHEATEVGAASATTAGRLSDAAPFLRLLSLREATEWRQSSLIALLAENVRLSQQLNDDDALLAELEVEGQCGVDATRSATASLARELDALQESVLSRYRRRLEQLATSGTRFLNEWQTQCISPVRALCASVALLLRLWHLTQQEELRRVHDGVDDSPISDGTTSMMMLLHELDTHLDESASTTARAEDAAAAATTLSLPALPDSAAAMKRPFTELARRTCDTLTDNATTDDVDTETAEALRVAAWCAEIPLEELPTSLQTAQKTHDELSRMVAEAGAAAAARTRRITALRAQLAELQANNEATRVRLDEEKATLARLVMHKAATHRVEQEEAAKVAIHSATRDGTRVSNPPGEASNMAVEVAEETVEAVSASAARTVPQELTGAVEEHVRDEESNATSTLSIEVCDAGNDDAAVAPASAATLAYEANEQDTATEVHPEFHETRMNDDSDVVDTVSPSAAAVVTLERQEDPFRTGFGFDEGDDAEGSA